MPDNQPAHDAIPIRRYLAVIGVWWRRQPAITRWAVVCWGLMILGVAVGAVHRGSDRGVWRVLMEAAQNLQRGGDLYVDTGFRYPPITAIVLVPFHLLGVVGILLWWGLNAGAYLGALHCAFRQRFPRTVSAHWQSTFFLLLLIPSATSLNNGQPNAIVVGCLVASTLSFSRGRYRTAAVWAALPVCIKVYPVAFGMLLCLLAPRRFLPWFAGLLAIGFALPYVICGPAYASEQYSSLVSVLAAEDRTGDPLDAYRDLRLLLESLGAPISHGTYVILQVAGGAAAAALLLAGRRAGWTAARLAAFALGASLCWMTVLGPATEKATYLLVAPLACYLVLDCRDRASRSWFRWSLAAYGVLLLTSVVTRVPREIKGAHPILRTVPTIATLMMAAALVATAFRRRAARDKS
jgi:hypothetical protein